jgi:hypothetical protein
MSVKPLQIDGMVDVESSADSQTSRRDTQRLEDENRQLRRDLEDALSDKERLERTVRNLQTTLNPIHRAMSILFGEMDLAVGETPVGNAVGAQVSTAQANGNDPRWESYKKQFPGIPTEIIDALLAHPEMTMNQLATLLKHGYRTIWGATDQLKKAGAVIVGKTGVSLKR